MGREVGGGFRMGNICKSMADRKRHTSELQSQMYRTDFGTLWERRGWDDLREQHLNMYIIKCEADPQSRLDA